MKAIASSVAKYPESSTVVDCFAKVVERSPHEIALRYGDEVMTFTELNVASDNIAFRLRQLGIGRKDIVAFCLRRGVGMITALLGILKIGATYIPFHPDTPGERIKASLVDIPCKLIICDHETLPFVSFSNTSYLNLDEIKLDSEATIFLPTAVDSTDLAYIMFTSGSTGIPKGVMIEHRHIMDYTFGLAEVTEIKKCKSLAFIYNISWDAGYTLIFHVLTFGGTLHILNEDVTSNPLSFREYFNNNSVDFLKITSSHYAAMCDELLVFPNVILMLGGERFSKNLAERINAAEKSCTIYNHYGPTETTIGKLIFPLPSDITAYASVPIGRPFGNCHLAVVDEMRQLCASGEVGELYIAGDGIARGYFNSSELTDKKFVTEQFFGSPMRCYKTGDLVVMDGQGIIEFIGRIDSEFKISGYRVHPEEVRVAIMKHPLIKDVAIDAIETKLHDGKILTAFIVGGDKLPIEADLIAFLRQQMPAHMIPERFFFLEKIPLNESGKIDYKILRQYLQNESHAKSVSAGEAKDTLEAIILLTLNTKMVDWTVPILDSGITSINLIRLNSKIYRHFGMYLPAYFLNDNPTINEISDFLAASKTKSKVADHDFTSQVLEISPVTKAERSFYFFKRFNPAEVFPATQIVLKIDGIVDFHQIENSFRQVISNNESLRTSYNLYNGSVIRNVIKQVDFHVKVVTPGHDDLHSVIVDCTKPFSFDRAPLIDVFYIIMPNECRYLYVHMPHINSDGMSAELIISQMCSAYDKKTELIPPNQYSTFVKSYLSYYSSTKYKDDLMFWELFVKTKLAEISKWSINSSKLPGNGYSVIVELPTAAIEQSELFRIENRISIYQHFLTIYGYLIHDLSGDDTFPILIPIHNRNEPNVENVIGLIANSILVSFDFRDKNTFLEMARGVRNELLASMLHSQFPFEELLDMTSKQIHGKKRTLLHHGFFNYQSIKEQFHLGDALLLRELNQKHRELLPLSLDVFEMGGRYFIKFQSSGKYDIEHLKSLSNEFSDLLIESSLVPSKWC